MLKRDTSLSIIHGLYFLSVNYLDVNCLDIKLSHALKRFRII